MVESLLSWLMLFGALDAGENAVYWFIASGIYAIAAHLSEMKKGEKNE